MCARGKCMHCGENARQVDAHAHVSASGRHADRCCGGNRRPRSPAEAQELGINFVHQNWAGRPIERGGEHLSWPSPAGPRLVRWPRSTHRARELLNGLGTYPTRVAWWRTDLAERQLGESARAGVPRPVIIMTAYRAPGGADARVLFPDVSKPAQARRRRHFISHG